MTEPSQYFKGRTVQEQMNEVIGYVDTRAAEVATEAIASDVAQVHQDMLDADAEFLEEEVGFSFTDVAVLKAFHDPDQLGS